MTDDALDLRADGADISDDLAYFLLFPSVFPEKDDTFRQTIERKKESLTIDGFMDELQDTTFRGRSSQDHPTPISLSWARDDGKVSEPA